MGLNDFEYSRIVDLMGREPTLVELGMFAVMWSEHCGYKYSRPVLALFSKYKEAMEGEGLENAGVVDIGDGIGVTMKVESHNHPSAVEPYQGAATGVGGIIRDILTMGARPIALLNSLRFGPIRDGEQDQAIVERNRYLFEHVVAGIAGYGNCVGVPTVAGEVNFHPRYSGNPLVNAMCVGILPMDQVTTAAASGVGNPVYYLGSSTGKDGIHGATFASDALGEDNEEKRPNVQIGDPFAEKLLIEATLEALATGAIVAIQDMGAAGLTCSTTEMASKGKVGMTVDLDKVPMRESDMTAYELMLSESQERMFAVAEKGREHEVEAVFKKWGINVVQVGEVTADGLATVTRHGKVEASVDPTLLTDHCPTYSPGFEVPAYHEEAKRFDPASLPDVNPNVALFALLQMPDIASKRFVWQQYDQHVMTQTTLDAGIGDAAVIAPRGTKKGVAVTLDGNARQVYLDPLAGGKLVVCEAARNVACTGALPKAVTDGLNFGNPQRPHVYWQFKEAVLGIAQASEAMGTPVISGNVSFYNESDLGEVLPTPMIGMMGVLEDASCRIGIAPTLESGEILLLWTSLESIPQEGLGASAFTAEVGKKDDGLPVSPNMAGERALCELLAGLAADRLIDCAHDSSEGGLAVAAAEIAILGTCGVELGLHGEPFAYAQRAASVFFGELPGRVLVGASADHIKAIKERAQEEGIGCRVLGRFDRNFDEVRIVSNYGTIDAKVSEMRDSFEGAIPEAMKGEQHA